MKSWEKPSNSSGNGKSAYQTWLDQGNTGSEQDFLNSLKGEAGLAGGAAGVSTKSIPAGVTKVVEIAESGIFKVNSGVLNEGLPQLAQIRHKDLKVFVSSDGTRSYLMQEASADNDDQNSYLGYKHFSSSVVRWKRIVTSYDLPLFNKKLLLLGDSIMASLNTAIISQKTGAIVTNLAKGGSSVALRSNPAMVAEWDPWALCTIAKTGTANSVPIENYDYAMIFITTNDWGHQHPVGTIDSTDELTILGAYNVALQNLLTRKPNLKLILATPQFRNDAETVVGYPKLSELSKLVEDLAHKYSIPCINMMKSGMISDYNKTTWLQGDLLHLNNEGSIMVSNKFGSFIAANY